jgi:hypothetical protein
VRDEFETKDNQLIGITSELERLREDQRSLKGEVKDRGSAIVTLQTELEKVRGEVLERDDAIATLKSELEAREDKQLSLSFSEPEPIAPPELIPEPEPEPENIKSPAVKPEPLTITPTEVVQAIPLILLDTIEGTVPRKVIMDRILEIDPATEINGQIITDAVLGHNQRLSELEITYGFKFVGYVMKGKNREYRYKLA